MRRLWLAGPKDGCKRVTTLVRTLDAGTSTSRADVVSVHMRDDANEGVTSILEMDSDI